MWVSSIGASTRKAQKHEHELADDLGCYPVLSASPPTADSPGVIPSFPLACVCCFSLNALPCIYTHRITNVINSQLDSTMAEKGQWRERRANAHRHTSTHRKRKPKWTAWIDREIWRWWQLRGERAKQNLVGVREGGGGGGGGGRSQIKWGCEETS